MESIISSLFRSLICIILCTYVPVSSWLCVGRAKCPVHSLSIFMSADNVLPFDSKKNMANIIRKTASWVTLGVTYAGSFSLADDISAESVLELPAPLAEVNSTSSTNSSSNPSDLVNYRGNIHFNLYIFFQNVRRVLAATRQHIVTDCEINFHKIRVSVSHNH